MNFDITSFLIVDSNYLTSNFLMKVFLSKTFNLTVHYVFATSILNKTICAKHYSINDHLLEFYPKYTEENLSQPALRKN